MWIMMFLYFFGLIIYYFIINLLVLLILYQIRFFIFKNEKQQLFYKNRIFKK